MSKKIASFAAAERADVYTRVTEQIIAAIEAGAAKFEMPWHVSVSAGRPVNVASKKAYRGINTVTLWCAQQEKGFGSSVWGTFKQWLDMGHPVRKGEKASLVVFWSTYEKPVDGSPSGSEEGETETRMFAKAYHVFNAEQVDGYVAPASTVAALSEAERITEAEIFVANTGAKIGHGGGRAYYRPSTDEIQMPEFSAFRDGVAYYSTLSHELTHWTSAEKRCNRTLGKRFGDEAYAAEELVAELGAAFVCSDLGLTPEPRVDHAGYIENWLKVLRSDKRAIFTAAALAQKALDYLHNLQPQQLAEAAD